MNNKTLDIPFWAIALESGRVEGLVFGLGALRVELV